MSPAPSGSPARRILILDDNEALASIIIDELRAEGQDAAWAPPDDRGLIMAAMQPPDLLFLGLRGDGRDHARVLALRRCLSPGAGRIIGVAPDRIRCPRPESLGLDAIFVAPLDPEAVCAAYRVVAASGGG